MANADRESIVTFDIFDESIVGNENILASLTEEEKNEVENVVTLLETAKQDSLHEFENDTNLLRHNPIDNSEQTGKQKQCTEC